MNREIKFRAWDKERKLMFYDVQKCYEMRYRSIWDDVLEPFSFGHFLADTDYVVSQFTGLLDKNGKELYEGDFIKRLVESTKWNREKFGITSDTQEVALIRWDGDSLLFEELFRPSAKMHPCIECVRLCDVVFEIIGNRYENPELLEGER
jgi:uncharacterized phage protein (TIGR01671 family)